MAPWLLPALGLPSSGAAFEAALWALLVVLGVLLLVRERRSARSVAEGWLGWGLGGGFVFMGVARCVGVAGGTLYLGPEGLRLSTYGVLMALGLGLSTLLAYRDAERGPRPMTGTLLVDLAFWAVLSGLLGARLLFGLTEWSTYVTLCTDPGALGRATPDCLAALRLWEGGGVFYGGVLGGLVGGAVWCRRRGVPFRVAADLVFTYLPLGHAIARLGCLAAGCCWGAECELPWAVHYPEGSPAFAEQVRGGGAAAAEALAAGHSHGTHPTAGYEALLSLGLFAWLFWRRRRARRAPEPAGRQAARWLVGYGVVRFLLETTRGDALRGFVVEVSVPTWTRALGLPEGLPTFLSTSQTVALGLVLFGAMLLRPKRIPAEDGAPD